MSAYINISLQGTVYFAARRSVEDDDMIRMYSSKLVGVARESTFDALYSQVAWEWHQQDDIVNPFHDRRRVHVKTVWTFDLDGDVLRLDKNDRNFRVPLSLVRQHSITISDFEPYEPPTHQKHTLQSILRHPYWRMSRERIDLQHLERRKAFVCRVLADFAFQWRHILCGRYNNSTFRRLACAIIRIATLDFNVEEITLSRQGTGGFLVWIHNLPEWDPFNGNIVRVGGTSIVISQHIPHAITLIREDFAKQSLSSLKHNSSETSDKSLTYLILSVQEISLYRINTDLERYTKPERLFNGTHPPSDEAIKLLLEATQTSAPTTPIRSLPIELQDMILDKVSVGPIESARVGSILNAGSVFTWKCGDRNIEREEGRRNRTPWTPVESHIRFGNYLSGIAYK
ncbi:hypothetical protein K432DRAFT_436015 [Lepidopterella palustris CBS 459.81]|uniref:Uncharacterized protein n=1 Tax=Lepidopterella palustris CBS 459.81 TaxID=1314670 RepID=A0A8E2E708_9PEZI|nr:hypothetical protein K432DRAFT_436015 [Lepidopterella palustris CBS 459.81]